MIIAFFSTNVLPASDQNFKCLTPTDTNCVSELGRNSARNIRSSDATEHAILRPEITKKIRYDIVICSYLPSSHRHTAIVYGVSTPTDSKNFPLVEKLNEQTPRANVFYD